MARDVYAVAERWLKGEGVDVDRALAAVDRAEEADRHRVRAGADRARSLAISLRKAERALLAESRGFSEGCPGFGRAELAAARERVNLLTEALTAACVDDPQLARRVARSVA